MTEKMCKKAAAFSHAGVYLKILRERLCGSYSFYCNDSEETSKTQVFYSSLFEKNVRLRTVACYSVRSDAQCGHFTASMWISDLQNGQILVVGAGSGAGLCSLLMPLITRKMTKAVSRNCTTI